jgi:hypothetical protein
MWDALKLDTNHRPTVIRRRQRPIDALGQRLYQPHAQCLLTSLEDAPTGRQADALIPHLEDPRLPILRKTDRNGAPARAISMLGGVGGEFRQQQRK